MGGADTIGFMWLSIFVLYFEIKKHFQKVTPLLTLKLCFPTSTSAAESPVKTQAQNVSGMSSAQIEVIGRAPENCFPTCKETRRKP